MSTFKPCPAMSDDRRCRPARPGDPETREDGDPSVTPLRVGECIYCGAECIYCGGECPMPMTHEGYACGPEGTYSVHAEETLDPWPMYTPGPGGRWLVSWPCAIYPTRAEARTAWESLYGAPAASERGVGS